MKKTTLYAVTYSSVLIFFAFLFGLIFVPAGTLYFWKGWIYWVVFCVSTFVITAYFLKYDPALIERRIRPTETRPMQMIGQSVAAVLFMGGMIFLPSLDYRLGWSTVPIWISILANILVIIGFTIVFAVFKVNTFTSRAVEHMEGQTVITVGPYSVVRHPMYSGAALIIFATSLALDSLWGLVPALLLMIVIVLRILDEKNQEIADKLRTVFAEWYLNGHTDEKDPNTIILRIRLTDGVLFSHGTRYDINFTDIYTI